MCIRKSDEAVRQVVVLCHHRSGKFRLHALGRERASVQLKVGQRRRIIDGPAQLQALPSTGCDHGTGSAEGNDDQNCEDGSHWCRLDVTVEGFCAVCPGG